MPSSRRRAGRGRGEPRRGKEGRSRRCAGLGAVSVGFSGVAEGGWPKRDTGGQEWSSARSGREEGRRRVREEAETGGRRRGAGARWGKGEAGGGAGTTRPEAPRRRAPTPLPEGRCLGRPARAEGLGRGSRAHARLPPLVGVGRGCEAGVGGARPPQRRNNNEPFRPGGVNPRGPPPLGKTGLPRLPLPRSRPPQRPVGGSQGSADSSSHNAPPNPRRGRPPHPTRPGVPTHPPRAGPGPLGLLGPSPPPLSPVPGGPGGAGPGRRRGVSPRPGDAAGGRREAGGIPVPLFVSGSSVPPRRLLLRLRLGLATRVSLSLGEKRKCSNSNY